jgi:hypothetical protein
MRKVFMHRGIGTALIALIVLLGASPLRAHHYFAAIFDASKKLTLTGTLMKVDWRNPHIEFFVDVKGDSGAVATWKIEGMAPNWFRTRNVNRSDFEKAIGHAVVADVMLARDGSTYGLLQKITFPDGISLAVPEQRNPN